MAGEDSGGGFFHIVFGGRGITPASVGTFNLTAISNETYMYHQILHVSLDSATTATIRPDSQENASGTPTASMEVQLGNATWPFEALYVKKIQGESGTSGWTDNIVFTYSTGTEAAYMGKVSSINQYALQLGDPANSLAGGLWLRAYSGQDAWLSMDTAEATPKTYTLWVDTSGNLRRSAADTAPDSGDETFAFV
jgi:hypothetical protein